MRAPKANPARLARAKVLNRPDNRFVWSTDATGDWVNGD